MLRPRTWFAAVAIAAAAILAQPAERAHAQSKVYTAAELTQPVSLKSPQGAASVIERHYPQAMQRLGGKVQLRFVVGPDGRVRDESVEVLAASVSALGDAAVRSIKQILFNPGQVNGEPVAAKVIFPVIYTAR